METCFECEGPLVGDADGAEYYGIEDIDGFTIAFPLCDDCADALEQDAREGQDVAGYLLFQYGVSI